MSPRGHPEPRTVVSLPSHDARLNLYVQTESDAPDFVNGLLRQVFDRSRHRLGPKYADWVIFEHCLPFNVSRAYEELQGIADPRIWTAARDKRMWRALRG